MIITYWFIVSLIILFSIIILLTNLNVILKNNKIGEILKSSLFKYIIKRILIALFTLFLIITTTFFIIKIMPKDYFYSETNSKMNSVYFGIDNSNKTIFQELFDYYYNILPFPKKVCTSYYLENENISCNCYEYKIINLGYSVSYMKNISVWEIIKEKSITSFKIGFLGYLLQCLIGYPLGIYIARKKGGHIDKTVNFLNIIIVSFPAIVYFYLFVLLFMTGFNLPVSFEKDNLITYIAPLVSLCFWGAFTIAYWVQKYICLETNKDYVKFAISKGLDDRTIFYKHIMKNALIPLIRTIPTSIVFCFSGYYLLESAFNIPGIGLTLITAINLQDVYLVQGLILFYSFLSVISYLIGDLITICLNKRVNLFKDGDKDEI